MGYPETGDLLDLTTSIKIYSQLGHEHGAKEVSKIVNDVRQYLIKIVERN